MMLLDLLFVVTICHLWPVNGFYLYKHVFTPSLDQHNEQNSHAQAARSLFLKAPIRRVNIDKRAGEFNNVHQDSPTTAPNSAAIVQDGTDYCYMVEVQFGDRNKPMFLLLDSAAVNTWVMSSNCTTNSCAHHSVYGTAASTSLKLTKESFSITYGTGSVGGIIGSDRISILGKSFNLTFGIADSVSEEFASYPMDGILGIGRLDNVVKNPNGIERPTLIDVLKAEKIIDTRVYGVKLSRSTDGRADGAITFGAPDKSAYVGEINNVPTIKNDRGFWEVAIDSIVFDGKAASIQKSATALLDTGTSFMLLPPGDAQAVHAKIPNVSYDGESFTVPCDTSMPLVITLGGHAYEISTKDYIAKPNQGKCLSNIISRQAFESNQWLVGDVFFKNVYTVFDADQSRVGFAILSASPAVNVSETSIATSPDRISLASSATTPAGSGEQSTGNRNNSSSSKVKVVPRHILAILLLLFGCLCTLS